VAKRVDLSERNLMADALSLTFKLITPTGPLFEGQVEEVTAVNPMGEFGVLPEHINYITAVVPCVVTVKLAGGDFRFFVVSGGLVEVKDGVMTLLAPTAQQPGELADSDIVSKDMLAAEEKMAQISFYEPGYDQAMRELQLARARERGVRLRQPPS